MKIPRFALVIACFISAPAYAASHFQSHHPDLHHRLQGMAAFEDNRGGDALREFKASARYADKGSQAMIAEMYWAGLGVARNRPLAYVWMDLAAERGYPLLAAKRELYWQQLSADERARALELGPAVFAEFEDNVAKPRMEEMLRRGTREAAGSRVGASAAFVDVYTDIQRGAAIGGALRGTSRPDYYAAKYWSPTHYWRRADSVWSQPLEGIVEIRPLLPETAAEPGKP